MKKIRCWCWWPFLCLQNVWNSPQKKHVVISLIFISKIQKNWIRFMVISKIELKLFQINLMFKFFMCLKLELLELIKKFYLLGITKKFKFSSPKFRQVFCCLHFPLTLHYAFKKKSQQEFFKQFYAKHDKVKLFCLHKMSKWFGG
jgi:hypothetical protein